jgi:succinyl-diaminopimelate desuccinylase
MPPAKHAATATQPDSPLPRRIERLARPMLDFAIELCRIPTVNPPGSHYMDCCEFLQRQMERIGLDARIVVAPAKLRRRLLPGSDDFPRPSVIGRRDVGAARTLHLTGHYDVGPPTAGWRTDPFKPVVRGKRLIARGSDDMKCADTAALFAIQAVRDAGLTPPWNIELSFTPDEETGGELGLGHLVRGGHIRPDAAVLLEGGSGPSLGYAHKGVLWLDVIVHGKPAHASDPRNGVNALQAACAMIGRLETLEARYAARRTAFRMSKARHKHPTIMPGGVAGGGGKVNTIPDRFHFTLDRRLLPEEQVADAKAEILAVLRSARHRGKPVRHDVRQLLHVPPGWSDLADPFCKHAAAVFRKLNRKPPRWRMTAGFTDMHYVTQEAGCPMVAYGTTGGGAHADFEYCNIPSMARAANFYAALAMSLPPDGEPL